jgi:hypothetical protein
MGPPATMTLRPTRPLPQAPGGCGELLGGRLPRLPGSTDHASGPICTWCSPQGPSSVRVSFADIEQCGFPGATRLAAPAGRFRPGTNGAPKASVTRDGSRPGPRWGRRPPDDHGQQRIATVSPSRRSAALSERSPRSSDDPDCLSHGGSQGFKSPHLHPQPRRSERRQRRAGGAHCRLRPHHGRTRKSQPSPEGSQRPGDPATRRPGPGLTR